MTPDLARQHLHDVTASDAPVTRKVARRTVMAIGALLPVIATACAGGGVTSAVSDINLVLQGLQKVIPGLQTAGVISSGTATQLQIWLADAQAAATAVANGTTGTTAGQQFLSAVESILGVLAALPVIPPPWNALVSAAAVLLPIIAAALGLGTPPSAVKLMARTPSMTVAEARAILTAQK